jgi:hypothetical protein
MTRSKLMWFKLIAVGSLAVTGAMASSMANAGANWSVGINLPGFFVGDSAPGYYEPAPVYSQQAPAYYPPAEAYYDAQPVRVRPPESVYYAPSVPVYGRPLAPRFYGPSPVEFEPGYRDDGRYFREHRDHHDRDDHEDYRRERGYRGDWDGYRR